MTDSTCSGSGNKRAGRRHIWRELEDFSPGTYRYIKNGEYVKSGKKKEVYGEFIVTSDGE